MLYIKLDSDHWDDIGQTYLVLKYKSRKNSTAVELELQTEHGQIQRRVVPEQWIEWVHD